MDLLKVLRFPYQKRLQNLGHFNLGKEILKGFSPDVFRKLCVSHSKSSNNGNFGPKNELAISPFLFKVATKATVVT